MISTILAVQEATEQAILNEETLNMARDIYQNRDHMTEDEFSKSLFNYSTHLSAITAMMVVGAILTKEEVHNMAVAVKELEDMGL